VELILEIWERYDSASEVTILWRYTNLFIIIIIIIIIFIPQVVKIPVVNNKKLLLSLL